MADENSIYNISEWSDPNEGNNTSKYAKDDIVVVFERFRRFPSLPERFATISGHFRSDMFETSKTDFLTFSDVLERS